MKESKIANNKILGIILLIIAIFGTLVIFHRIGCYFYEYDPKFASYDYGRFNFFSYFTVQSNIFVCIYLYFASFAILGNKKAKKIVFNPMIGALVTTYIIVTGAVYCCGIPMGFTPPFTWDTPVHGMSSFIQVFHHMIIPPLMILLWLFPFTNEKISYKKLPIFGIYPFVYSIFSIIRGAVSNPQFFAYPFYNPEFDYGLFSSEGYTVIKGYLSMIPLLIVGIGLFILIAALVILIRNKRITKI